MTDRKAFTLAEAAQLTGLSEEALRQRFRRHKLEGYKANDGKLRVYIDPDRPVERSVEHPTGQLVEQPTVLSERPAQELRVQLAVAEAERDAERRRAEDLQERVASLERRLDEARAERRLLQEAHEAEVDRLLGVIEQLAAERRPERRPWPGLRAWLQRVWEGNG